MLFVPATLAAGTVASLDGRENHLDHLGLWRALPPPHALTYAIGDILCHQKSWRSFFVNGNQLPVDERMTAIFAAAAPGMLLSFRLPIGPFVARSMDGLLPLAWQAPTARAAARRWTLLVVLALAPAAVDVLWENALARESTTELRVLTGAIAGIAGGLVLGAFLASFDHVFGRRLTAPRRASA